MRSRFLGTVFLTAIVICSAAAKGTTAPAAPHDTLVCTAVDDSTITMFVNPSALPFSDGTDTGTPGPGAEFRWTNTLTPSFVAVEFGPTTTYGTQTPMIADTQGTVVVPTEGPVQQFGNPRDYYIEAALPLGTSHWRALARYTWPGDVGLGIPPSVTDRCSRDQIVNVRSSASLSAVSSFSLIEGPQGPAGPAGPQGPKGDAGAQGPAGTVTTPATTPTPAPTVAPVVFSAPTGPAWQDGQAVSGVTVVLAAITVPNFSRAMITLDGTFVGAVLGQTPQPATAKSTIALYTAQYAPGPHVLKAIVTDTAGNQTVAQITVNVQR